MEGTPQHPHRLLVNPSAGGGRVRSMLPQIEQAMAAHGLPFEITETRSIEHGRDAALRAAGAGETVVVVSGDGLIGQVGGALADTNGVLGVIPGGRGNDFARVVGIPTEADEAVALLRDRPVRSIDVGVANDQRFLCIASCGFDSDANRIANETRFVRGNLVYAYAALRALAAWKPARFEVEVDGATETVTGYSVAVANSKAYGGGMFIAPDAELDDGELDVITSGESSKLHFLASLPKVFKGEHVNDPEVTVRRGAKVRVSADRPFELYADGDHVADLPVELSVLPGALRVIAPTPS